MRAWGIDRSGQIFYLLIIRKGFPLLANLAFLSCVGLASADDVKTERVEFAAGATGAEITGKVTGYDSVGYKVGARDGQFFKVSLRPDNQSAEYNIYIPGLGPGEEALFTSATGGREYVGQLYKTGDPSI